MANSQKSALFQQLVKILEDPKNATTFEYISDETYYDYDDNPYKEDVKEVIWETGDLTIPDKTKIEEDILIYLEGNGFPIRGKIKIVKGFIKWVYGKKIK